MVLECAKERKCKERWNSDMWPLLCMMFVCRTWSEKISLLVNGFALSGLVMQCCMTDHRRPNTSYKRLKMRKHDDEVEGPWSARKQWGGSEKDFYIGSSKDGSPLLCGSSLRSDNTGVYCTNTYCSFAHAVSYSESCGGEHQPVL